MENLTELVSVSFAGLWPVPMWITGRIHANQWPDVMRIAGRMPENTHIDGKIPSFYDDDIDIGLYGKLFEGGTIIKLFSYKLSDGSNITLDLWRKVNVLLYSPAYPILFWERREFKGHSNTKLMLGNLTRIMIDSKNSVYKMQSFRIVIPSLKTEVPFNVVIFRKRETEEGKGGNEWIQRSALVYLINGQTHASLTPAEISEKTGMKYLKDHMLIIVDCSKIRLNLRKEMFKSSRDQIRDSVEYRTFYNEIISAIRNDELLNAINQEYRGEITHSSSSDLVLVENELAVALSRNKELASNLTGTESVNSLSIRFAPDKRKSKPKKDINQNNIDLKLNPTFITALRVKGNRKKIPLGGKGYIDFSTDASNDYNGVVAVEAQQCGCDRKKSEENSAFVLHCAGPSNGNIRITLIPVASVEIGQVYSIFVHLKSVFVDLVASPILVEISTPKPKVQKKKNTFFIHPQFVRLSKTGRYTDCA